MANPAAGVLVLLVALYLLLAFVNGRLDFLFGGSAGPASSSGSASGSSATRPTSSGLPQATSA